MVTVLNTIMSGFKAAGVFPSNRKAIKIPGEDLDVTNTPTAVVAWREGINYMPFLSGTGASSNLEKEDGTQFEN